MTFQIIDYSRIPVQEPDYSGIKSIIPGLLGGYKSGTEMKQTKEQHELKKKAEELANAVKEKYGEQQAAAELALTQAQAAHHARLGQEGGGRAAAGGGSSRGGAQTNLGKAFKERALLAEEFGKDSSQVRAYDNYIDKQSQQTLTPGAKVAKEKEDIDAGFIPGTNRRVKATPEQQKELSDQIELQKIKLVSDPQTRQRALYANNLITAMEKTNIDDLLAFSGPKGQIELKAEQAKDLATGKPSEKYRKYLSAVANAKAETKEARQFLGASIQPSETEAIELLINPSGWTKSKEAARAYIEPFRNLLKTQAKTYSGALKGPEPYRNKEAAREINNAAVKQNIEQQFAQEEAQGQADQGQYAPGAPVKGYLNGKTYTIPAEKVNEFIAKGGKING